MQFTKTIEAISEIFVVSYGGQAKIFERPHNFILIQIDNMPDLFRFAFKLITFFFLISVFIKYGKKFDELSQIDKVKVVNKWRNSKITFCRDFIRFFEAFVIFHLTSQSGF